TQITVTSSYAGSVLPALLILGLGFGMIFAPAINTATTGVQRKDSGVASALAFAPSAALFGAGALLAFFLLPSRQRLQQLRSAQAPASAAPAGETETA